MISNTKDFNCATAVANSQVIDMREWDGRLTRLRFSAGTTATFFECDTIDGTFEASRYYSSAITLANLAVTITANTWIPMPPQLYGARFIKIQTNVASVVTVCRQRTNR